MQLMVGWDLHFVGCNLVSSLSLGTRVCFLKPLLQKIMTRPCPTETSLCLSSCLPFSGNDELSNPGCHAAGCEVVNCTHVLPER